MREDADFLASQCGFALDERIEVRRGINADKSAMGEHLVGLGHTHGLLEGDRTASGPGPQWLHPAIFRRAPAATRKHILDD